MTSDELAAIEVGEALQRLQSAINDAFREGLDFKVHVEEVGDCVGLRKRPTIIIQMSRPLALGSRADLAEKLEGHK